MTVGNVAQGRRKYETDIVVTRKAEIDRVTVYAIFQYIILLLYIVESRYISILDNVNTLRTRIFIMAKSSSQFGVDRVSEFERKFISNGSV